MKPENNLRPPKWVDKFLSWIIAPRFIDEIQGDLHEAFHRRCTSGSILRAKLRFVFEAFRSISLTTVDKSLYSSLTSLPMIANNLKTGWRNFLKYKTYSLINLFGLSLGFSSALLLFLIVRYERSFDDFHENAAHIYRVGTRYLGGGFGDRIVVPQVPLMDEEYADIIAASRFFTQGDIVNFGEQYVNMTYTFVDPGFAKIFDFRMIAGDMETALAIQGHILLTRNTATRLFGEADPMGKTISMVNEKTQFVVAGIVEDVPSNSTLQFEALVPWSNAPKWLDIDQMGNWYNTFMEGYVMLDPKATRDAVETKLEGFVARHFLEERKSSWRVLLLPLADEHFRLTGSKQTISILSILAGGILFISCINFANLSIAQTLRRIREIGVRRVLGSLKRQVAIQFGTESFIVFALSLLAGTGLAYLVIPFVNQYFGFRIEIGINNLEQLLLFLASACFILILSSMLGTAMALTKLKPVHALKGIFGGVNRGESIRRALLVVQVAISIVLLSGSIVVWQQTHYMKSQDLKFSGNNVVIVDTSPELFRNGEHAKQRLSSISAELKAESAVSAVSFTTSSPGVYNESYNAFMAIDSVVSDKTVSLRKVYTGEGYFETMRMELIAGRDFSENIRSDTAAVILNETAMREFGWTDINNKVLVEGGDGDSRVQVIGVVKDYFYQSLKNPIQPLIHIYSPKAKSQLAVQFKPGREKEGLNVLEEKWKKLDAFEPFNYRFVDKTFEALYQEQERLAAAAAYFSVIAIIIACLGLLSMASYSIRLRRKEVGIRKVLGATAGSIILNLSRQYGLMVMIGFMVACPVVYFLTNAFLEGFAYRITLSPMVFLFSGSMIFLLSACVVGMIAGAAASESPMQALKEDG